MTFRTTTHVKAGRKAHRCDYCGSMIPAGWPSIKTAQVWEGDFYQHRGHIDCEALWREAFDVYGDYSDGMDIDLCEAIEGDEDREIVQAAYDFYRGRYPHVICRLELRWQRGDIAGRDRYRAFGLEPTTEDYPEVYG